MTRALSLAFGLLMVAAATVQAAGPALAAAVVALAAVVMGLAVRAAATLAVVASVVALTLSSPAPVVAALAGLAAAAYLVLRHAWVGDAGPPISTPTVLGALGLSAVAVLGTAIPLALPWVPLVAPLAVVTIYALVVAPLVS